MMWLPIAIGGVAGVFWLSALVHWVLALTQLSGRRSLVAMLFWGLEAFNPDNFTAQGQVYRKRFVYSACGFAAAILVGVGAGAIAAQLVK